MPPRGVRNAGGRKAFAGNTKRGIVRAVPTRLKAGIRVGRGGAVGNGPRKAR